MGSDTGKGGQATGKQGQEGSAEGNVGKDREGRDWSGGADGEKPELSRTIQPKKIRPLVGHVLEYWGFYKGAIGEKSGGSQKIRGHPFRDLQHPKPLQCWPGVGVAKDSLGER